MGRGNILYVNFHSLKKKVEYNNYLINTNMQMIYFASEVGVDSVIQINVGKLNLKSQTPIVLCYFCLNGCRYYPLFISALKSVHLSQWVGATYIYKLHQH